MSVEDNHSGIPTRAIHEAYLDMQRALKSYREAKDTLQDYRIQQAHRDVQATTVTLFELLRPYIKQGATSDDYWHGEAPPYPDNRMEPDSNEGVAILQVQRRTNPFQIDGNINLQNGTSVEDLHQYLDLGSETRIIGYATEDDVILVAYHAYMMGLKHLDNWETKRKTQVVKKDGFMRDKTETVTQAKRIEMPKLKRAARSLGNVCHELGLLAQVDETRETYHAGGDDSDHPEPFGTAKKPE